MKKHILVFLFFAVVLQISSAQEVPPKPQPARYVNDFASLMNLDQARELEQKLLQYYYKTSSQIVIVTIQSLAGYSVEEYANTLARQWEIGQKEKNNGVLLLMSLTDKKIRIEAGYGFEGILSDAKSKEIIETLLVPSFRKGDFYGGFHLATDEIIRLAGGEFEADKNTIGIRQKEKEEGDFANTALSFLILFLFVILIIVFFRSLKHIRPATYKGQKTTYRRKYSGDSNYNDSQSGSTTVIVTPSYSDYSDYKDYSDYSDSKYSDYSDTSSYSDYSDSSFGGGDFGGGGASGSW